MKDPSRINVDIEERSPVPGVKILGARTGVREAVTISGSIPAGRLCVSDKPLLADIAVEMLDEGTEKKNKRELREELERLGASIEFESGGKRITFTLHVLRENLRPAISILMEELICPVFPADTLATVKKRLATDVRHAEDDTYDRGYQSYLSTLYPKNHPNFELSSSDKIKGIKESSRVSLLSFHKNTYGPEGMIIAAAGDIDIDEVSNMFAEQVVGWKFQKIEEVRLIAPVKERKSKNLAISIAEKTSVDFFAGHRVPFTIHHPDYLAFIIALHALGSPGGFGSRLMQEIREKRGLTYGIYALPGGFTDGFEGHFLVWGTFAPEMLAEGRRETLNVINEFIKKGVTNGEVESKKQKILGRYSIDLSTTGGLSSALRSNAELGRPADYFNQFLDRVQELKTKDVNRVIKTYFSQDKITTVAAGSIKHSHGKKG